MLIGRTGRAHEQDVAPGSTARQTTRFWGNFRWALAYAVAVLWDHQGRIGNGLNFDQGQSRLDRRCWGRGFRWSCSLPFTLATASGLFPAAFLASVGGSISLSGMPRPPVLRRFPTSRTAITSLGPRWQEPVFAAFKEAPATARVPTTKGVRLTRHQRAGTLDTAHGRFVPERSGGGKVVLPAATLRLRHGRRSSRRRRQTHARLLAALHTCEGMEGHRVEANAAIDESRNGSTGSAIMAQLLAAANNSAAKMSHEQFLTWLQDRHEARGYVPRTREEVDASLRAERESWDD